MNIVHDNGAIVKLRLSPGASGRAVFPKEIRLPEACRGRTVKQIKGKLPGTTTKIGGDFGARRP